MYPLDSINSQYIYGQGANGIGGTSYGQPGGNVGRVASPSDDGGDIVSRLNRMDSAIIKPEAQDEYRANNIDLYA